ncbi:MAG TPA: hypothetical protein VFU41_02800 [Gemmatimonadales bacterium]|nr:hypothetical protein [Gemmatimonadales bacterium]
MRNGCRSLAPLALALLAAACGRAAQPGDEPAPRAETAVQVVNQSYLDMNVYVVRGGQRLRLGTVTGLSTQVFILRPDMIGPASRVQFEVHPIGARGNPRTETITVDPGDVIELTIPPS